MEQGKNKKPIVVLLIDEDDESAQLVQQALTSNSEHSFEVKWEKSADQALIELSSNPNIDIILDDFQSSDVESWEFCLQLNQSNIQKPLVLLTDTKNFRATVEAMKLGVEDVLFKGDLFHAQLPKTIVSILGRVQLRVQKQAIDKRLLLAENQARAIRELVVTVCHEFNNPLAAIKISLDLLKRQFTTSPEVELLEEFNRHFGEIDKEIKQLRDLNFERPDMHEAPHPLVPDLMKKSS
ncbi:MAG TPA: response regulator [Bacteroidota bacterium]|nr:response regulator [Bacteroidota bacterium]